MYSVWYPRRVHAPAVTPLPHTLLLSPSVSPLCHRCVTHPPQGEDAVHDAIRQRLLEVDVPRRVKAALLSYGASNDDVLWAALFALAILVRESSSLYGR